RGLLHHAEELPGVGGERLDVAALPFRVDRVEGQRRLAGPRQPRDHDEAVARDLDIDILEVVLAGAADNQRFIAHRVVDEDRKRRRDDRAGSGYTPEAAPGSAAAAPRLGSASPGTGAAGPRLGAAAAGLRAGWRRRWRWVRSRADVNPGAQRRSPGAKPRSPGPKGR